MSKEEEPQEPETWNQFGVGMQGEKIVILFLPRVAQGMTPRDALNLAAFIVAIADDHGQFPELLKKVCGT